MATDYVTSAALKKTLGITAQSYADDDIATAITAASRGIDNVCQRRFYLDTDANQVRYYTPERTDRLEIDDLTTLTTLQHDPDGDGTFDETWTVNVDFVLEPLNAAQDASNLQPWTRIRVHPLTSFTFEPRYPRTVKLTGKFGWPAVPTAIAQAAGVLAAKLVQRSRNAPFGVVAVFDAGAVAQIARNDPDVMFLISPYMRHRASIG